MKTETDIETKYKHLLVIVEKLIKYQKEFLQYRASSDLDNIKKLQHGLDKIIERERSIQKSLF